MSGAATPPTTPDPGADELFVDPADLMRKRGKSPELGAFLAWMVPGAGHLYAGHLVKGVGGLVLVLGLFVAGLALSRGDAVSLREVGGHEYAFLAQIGAGGPTALGLAYNHGKLPAFLVDPPEYPDFEDPAYAARLPDLDTGLLFTMVAGLLNLLLIHDVISGVPGGLARRREEERRRRRREALRAELAAEQATAAAEQQQPTGGGEEGQA